MKTVRTWSSSGGDRVTLQLNVWIPAVVWSESTRAKVIESAVKDLRVQPGYYDEGELILWTGGGFLKISISHRLDLP